MNIHEYFFIFLGAHSANSRHAVNVDQNKRTKKKSIYAHLVIKHAGDVTAVFLGELYTFWLFHALG